MKQIFSLVFLVGSSIIIGQQNQQLYDMHYIAESNFLNPAVQSKCKWFIGLPVISSVHFNYANSATSFNQLIEQTSAGTYNLNIDKTIKNLGRRTFIGTELHTTLLALGHKRNNNYYNFSIIEKNNIPLTISKDVFSLAWKGNTQFVDDEASLKGTSAYAVHYREYALGISKKKTSGDFLGIKAKLLFGKLNFSMPKSDVSLFTAEKTFDLSLDGDFQTNISGLREIDFDQNQPLSIGYLTNSVQIPSITELLFNRKNWGLAIDLGFIHPLNKRAILTASILDIGFIRWRSNLNNITAHDNFSYRGILVDTINASTVLFDNDAFNIVHNPYTNFLPTKAYLGVNYQLTPNISSGGVLSAVVYKTKTLTAATIMLDYNPFGQLHLTGSYSVFYRSNNNIGLALVMGRNPVQFYIISDNMTGFIWPLSARNINLRFGLNINLGCKEKKEKTGPSTSGAKTHDNAKKSFRGSHPAKYCPAYQKDDLRRIRKAGINKN